jgi:hypothetical protein
VNVNRSTAGTLEAVCRPHLTRLEIGKLLQARARGPIERLPELLATLGLSQDRREIVEQMLTTRSAVHGLWIASRNGDKVFYRFAADGEEDQPVVHEW